MYAAGRVQGHGRTRNYIFDLTFKSWEKLISDPTQQFFLRVIMNLNQSNNSVNIRTNIN